MAISLGFHILFAVAGMAMPLLMVLSEGRYLRSGEREYQELAQRWAKGTAILFAVGAVSGTVLSFELGLLWPRFMEHAGPLIGMPFSLEGFAFFLEAIALGVYLYGWKRVSPRVHLLSGVVVAISGLASGVFVVAVNAFMNTPQGFRVTAQGEFVDIDLWRAFFTPAFPTQAAHTAVSAYSSVGFAVLGIHAFRLLKEPGSAFHRAAVRVLLPVAFVAALLQAVTGDLAAKQLAEHQPVKLAAAEGLFQTERGAGLALFGVPDTQASRLDYALRVPKALSLLARGDLSAEVKGLDSVARDEWPNVTLVFVSFHVMVACGLAMLGVGAWGAWKVLRKRAIEQDRRFLWAATACGPLGLVAVEAGWMVTELGRQPWILRGVMRTADAVTPMPNLVVSLLITCAIYAFLGLVVAVLLARYVLDYDRDKDAEDALVSSPTAGERR
jgi:cytochrome d ubiquinol oxidase subunit I